jgi:hypothetical protein
MLPVATAFDIRARRPSCGFLPVLSVRCFRFSGKNRLSTDRFRNWCVWFFDNAVSVTAMGCTINLKETQHGFRRQNAIRLPV